MYRSRARASSTAATEPSLPTSSGRISGISAPPSFSSSGEEASSFGASASGSASTAAARVTGSVRSAGALSPSGGFVFFASSVMSSFPLPSFPSSDRHRDPALPAAPVRDLRDRDHEDPVRHPRGDLPEVHRAPDFEGPLELPEDPLQAEEGGFARRKIRGLLPGDLDPVPHHPDLHGRDRDPRDLQQDPDGVVHLHDVGGRLACGPDREREQQDMPGSAGRQAFFPDLPRRFLARAGNPDLSAHVNFSFFRNARRPGPISGSFSAKATFAIWKPSFVPASYRTPSNSRPMILSVPIRDRIASVSWISPPAPGLVDRRAGKIDGGRRYRPMIARSDGASAGLGFSTMSSTSYTRSAIRFPRMIPYLETASLGTRWIARTTPALYFSYALNICFNTGTLASITSSERMTANDSWPTRSIDRSTACPSPSGRFWRT